MRYSEMVSLMPRSLSRLFYTVPRWAEAKMLDPDPVALQIYKAEREGIKKQWLEKFHHHRETLSTILLIFLLKKYFFNANKMIEVTLSTLKELDIEEFNIGSVSFSEGSESVEFIKSFYQKLEQLAMDDEVLSSFIELHSASQIILEYRKRYSDEDLRL